MRALVGRFVPEAGSFRARHVELEGQPTWTLVQLRAMWAGQFRGNTDRLVGTLLRRDWQLLAATEWPTAVVEEGRDRWRYVSGVGRAEHGAESGPVIAGSIGNGRPFGGECWAYLWEHQLGALHVYAAYGGEWHHLATLPPGVWADLTTRIVVDVEARWCWLARKEAAA
ncbi:hypothetical protein [Micromonospora sp. WMMD1082]|uniref:hypothetical protein n=1 Tax=Micromonospora sp. WMMD1082 TaxID=3016104 RepID=UPI0024167D51|nr:hypothetical protein [Micromonospora sp. WMMD1082]MDG4796948.1 hypothetical protein [Micromonospora sp. WMMD1082]